MYDQSPVEVVFFAALEKSTPEERAAYLDGACAGDGAVRRRVEALLAAHPQVGQFLERPIEQAEGVAALGGGEVSALDLSFLTHSARPDSLGRLGQYEVLEVLGSGGFGIVFRAYDEKLQRVVAVKVLAPELAVTSPARKRFLREARSSAKVRHEHVVQVYAVEEQPLPHLVMEFIPGETLQERLDRAGPLDTAEVVQIGRQIAEGLAAAHGTGLIHRDIKPANILLEAGPNPCAKITDFGLARTADDASLTQSGIITGTPLFMAPEQAHGDKLDHRVDLFSLGSVLYTMCTGRTPFRAKSTLAVLNRVAEDTPRPIPEIIPEVPLWLCHIITRLHAKKPEDRIGTAKEVADLLRRGAETQQNPENVTPLRIVAPALRPRSGARRWAAAAACFLLLLGGLGFTEATGVTKLRGTVVRLFSPEGTLVVEIDDSEVSVQVDGADLVIKGAGAKEIRLKPGTHTVEARKDGKIVSRELITVSRNGREVVRVSQEVQAQDAKTATNSGDAVSWERSVASLPAEEQAKAVSARLKELNAHFNGTLKHKIEGDVVTELRIDGPVTDISPVRALAGLKVLECTKGLLSDLAPLKNMKLTALDLGGCKEVRDLKPLEGMPLVELMLRSTQVKDLKPLQGMPLTNLNLWHCNQVRDLAPLKGMPLTNLNLYLCPIHDLAPLRGMPLTKLYLAGCSQIRDLTPLAGMPLTHLNLDNTQVRDLTPLKGMQLTHLSLWRCEVSDLTPLKGLPLLFLSMQDCPQVQDLTPLEGMPLQEISLTPGNLTRGLNILRAMKNLDTIRHDSGQSRPAAEFWARFDKGEFK